jgi:hypothetical protein
MSEADGTEMPTIQEPVVEAPEAVEAVEAPAQEPVVDDGGGEGAQLQQEAPKSDETPEEGALTPENYLERVKKLREKTQIIPPEPKKEPLPGDPKPAEAAEVKPGEEPVKPAEVEPVAAEEWKAKEKYTFKSLGKDYELPKFATEGLKNAEDEKALIETYEKALGLDHVKQRHQELHGQHQELQTAHSKLNGGVEDLKQIYSTAVKSGNPLLLDDFFAKLNIPADVVLQYAMARVQYEQADQGQRQVVDNQLNAQRQLRDTSKQAASLTSRAESSESRALELEFNSSLARPEVATIAQTYDTQPGRKPGDFRVRVAEHGEYVYLKSGGKTVLAPDEAISQVASMYGVGQVQPAAPQGGVVEPVVAPVVPAAAPVTAAAPVVIPAGQKPVHVLPATPAGGTVSPAKRGITSIEQQREALKKLTG